MSETSIYAIYKLNTETVPIRTVALALLLTAVVSFGMGWIFGMGWMGCREAADAIERGEHRKENE